MIQYVLEAIDGCPYISDIVISGIQPKDIEPYSPSKNCHYIKLKLHLKATALV